MMKLLKTVNTKGVQDPGLNPSGDILPRSSLFKDFTCEGIGHWILVVSCSFTGGSLKQEIINHRDLAFSFCRKCSGGS